MTNNHKKIWITGASSGIGKSVAEKFASHGWKVAVSARREDILNQMSSDSNIFAFPCDITDKKLVDETFKKIINEFEELDICLFSSGTYDPKQEQSINTEKIRDVINVNFLGVVECVKVVEKYFKSKKSGQISIVSSIAGYRGLPNSSGYGPSKAALTNFAESIYFDFKKYNVNVSVISPGFIQTPLTDKNDFSMPFLKSPEFAAKEIYSGLIKNNAFEIHFPKSLTLILKFLRIMPYKLYLFLVDKLVKR